MRRGVLITAVLLVCVAPLCAQGVLLRHKLAPGESLTYNVTLTGSGTIAAMGMNQPMVMRGTLVYTQRCLSVDPQGNLEVRTTCAPPKIAAMWGEEVLPVPVMIPTITVTMKPTGQIVSSKLDRPALPAAVEKGTDALGLTEALSLLGPLLGEVGLDPGRATMMAPGKELFDVTKLFGALQGAGFPEAAVNIGAQWHEQINMDLARAAQLQTRCDSTLLAVQPVNGETIATIRTSYETPLSVPLADQVGAFTLSGNDKGTTTSEFSIDRGRVLKTTGQTVSAMKMEAGDAVGLLGIPVSVSMAGTTKYEVTLQ